jgi:Tyrosine phosphatase family
LPSAKQEFGKLFRSLGEKSELPAVFHCTTGKDRTGWAAAALLTLLGVPKDVAMQDYLRSNDYIIPTYQEIIDKFAAAGGEPEIPQAILGVKKEYLANFSSRSKPKSMPASTTICRRSYGLRRGRFSAAMLGLAPSFRLARRTSVSISTRLPP